MASFHLSRHSLLPQIKDSHIDEEGREIAHDQADDAHLSEIIDGGDCGAEQGDKSCLGNNQCHGHRNGHMVCCIDHRLHQRHSFAQFLIHAVVELNGIVYADSYQNGEGSKCGHAHFYIK